MVFTYSLNKNRASELKHISITSLPTRMQIANQNFQPEFRT